MLEYSGAAYGEETFDRLVVPEREEIEEMDDHSILWDLLDEIDCACVRIQICLQYPGEMDRDWFFRARSALIRFQIGRTRIERRLKTLGRLRPGPEIVAFAPTAA